MLAAVLGVLKIIGFILLGLLGLVLLLLLLALFVPVRYKLEASYYGSLKASVRVSWLLHILSFRAEFEDELNAAFRIFGIRFRNREPVEDVNETDYEPIEETIKEAADGQNPKPERWTEPEREKPDPDQNDDRAQQLADDAARHSEKYAEKQTDEQDGKKDNKQDDRRDKNKRRQAGKKSFSITGIYDRLKGIKEKIKDFYTLLKKEEKTLKLFLKQCKRLLFHILPRRARGEIRFGFEDPYTTGQVLTIISPFYGMYGKRFVLTPVFEEPVLEGRIFIRGRIRVATLIWIIVWLWRDPNIRRLWRQWRG